MRSYLRLRRSRSSRVAAQPQQLGDSKKRWKSIHKSAEALNKISGKWK